jgi:hypothetical protein
VRYFAASIIYCISSLAQAPEAKPDDKCSVEGTVINSATGEPVKKARVTLAPVGPPVDLYATTTDSTGHFLIDEVDAGRYSLTASRVGYTKPTSTHGRRNSNAALTLEKGQEIKEVVLKLAPDGVIAGRVLDADGDPVAEVAIQCMRVGYENGKHNLADHIGTNTNDLGEFRLPGLMAGKYIVSANFSNQNMYAGMQKRPAQKSGQGQATEEAYVTTYYPHTMNPSSASPIEVSPGAQINGINLTLMRARTVHIKGVVSAEIKLPTGIPWVSLHPLDEIQSGKPQVGGTVGPGGDFLLGGVVPGSYVLLAGCMVFRDRKYYTARIPVEIHDSNIEGMAITLRPPREFRGQVIIEDKGDLRGATLDAWLQPKDGTFFMGGGSTQVKEDLTFKIDNVGMALYDFGLRGYPDSFYLKSMRMGDQDVTATGLDFTQEAEAAELTVVLSPNAGVVEGSVQNTKDEAAPGAKVTLIPDAKHRLSTLRYKTADTDQNGHFVIKGVAPGEYKIFAWEDIEEGASEDPEFMKPHESDGQTVSIKERGYETVQLKTIPAESAVKEKPAG